MAEQAMLEATVQSAASRGAAEEPDPAQQRSYLLVFEAGVATVHFLHPDHPMVVGRGDQADLRVRDASVSRAHARLTGHSSGALLEDLGSHNGTRVNGERIEGGRELQPGDVVLVGTATLVFHRDAQSRSRRRVLLAPLLRERVVEEAERARRHGRPVVVVAVAPGDDEADPGRLAEAAAGRLRLLDSVAWDGRYLLLLLPELTAEVAPVPIGRVLDALAKVAPRVRAGYVSCPDDGLDAEGLLAAACNAADHAPVGKLLRATPAAKRRVGDRDIVAAAPSMMRLFQLVERLAESDAPVLVSGESGSGKEIVATALHAWSARRVAPFLGLSCAALPESMIESELFGQERGAVFSADVPREGILERAEGGVVLLDEVGELSASAQERLLRVLETGRLCRVGGSEELEVDVRIVASTDCDLEREIDEGRFRRDLFFRLSAATILVPPLRERPQDVPILARTFLDEACARAGRPALDLRGPATERLTRYRWPGNVRELKSAMEYAAVHAQGNQVLPDALPAKLVAAQVPPAPAAAPAGPPLFRNINDEIRELERARMQAALESVSGQQLKAAELIGMSLGTFVSKVKLYGLAAGK